MSKDKQLIILCLLTLIVALVGIPDLGAIAQGTTMRLEPADLVVGLDETFVVRVMIEEASDLGAFQLDLTYDSSILQVKEVALGDFLESTGRSTVPIGPDVNHAEGRTTFGVVSFGNVAGPSGTGVLATITCIAKGEGDTALRLQGVQVLDTAAGARQVTVKDGQVAVRSPGAWTSATPPPPSPSPTLPAATSVPQATGPSDGVVIGLMLAALAVAILAVFIFGSRREGFSQKGNDDREDTQ